MTEIEEEINVVGMSKFMRIALVISAMILILVGPTYIPYLMSDILKVNYLLSITVGGVLFIAGIMLMLFLIKKKVIT